MIALATSLLGGLFGRLRAEWSFLVLLAVAGVGAWLYAGREQARAQAAQLAGEAALICASSGAEFGASVERTRDTAGKPVTVAHARGAVCQRQVRDLAAFRARTDQETARVLADAMKAHDARQTTDTLAARDAAEAAQLATLRMETADAEAERRNIVDREWFAAVNGLAGLRSPPAR